MKNNLMKVSLMKTFLLAALFLASCSNTKTDKPKPSVRIVSEDPSVIVTNGNMEPEDILRWADSLHNIRATDMVRQSDSALIIVIRRLVASRDSLQDILDAQPMNSIGHQDKRH